MKIERLDQIRENSHLLSFSDGTVVRDLADEIELLRKELERRDKIVEGLVEKLTKDIKEHHHNHDDPVESELVRCQNQLIVVEVINESNQRIHDDLQLSPESTESEVSDA